MPPSASASTVRPTRMSHHQRMPRPQQPRNAKHAHNVIALPLYTATPHSLAIKRARDRTTKLYNIRAIKFKREKLRIFCRSDRIESELHLRWLIVYYNVLAKCVCVQHNTFYQQNTHI